MFRIGQMRSAHLKASADELLIGFSPILLKFRNGPLSPPSPGAGQSSGLPRSSNPKDQNPPKIPGRMPARPWAAGKKKGVERKMEG
jgi:hypothetical protein